MRSEDVKDLNFSLKEDIIPPGFYQAEVKVKKWRHLIFATEQQLSQLAATKTWYIDRNDKIVKDPFTNLYQLKCICYVCGVCNTSAISICLNILKGKERLQEG